MKPRPITTILMLMIALILALSAGAQQRPVAPGFSPAKPFTQDQVQAMGRDGLGDETGAKAIEQRGIDFAPTEDFIQSLKAAGASQALLGALRAAKHPQPTAEAAKKPLNQVQVFALLIGQVPSSRVTMLVQERGIDFDPTNDYLQEVRLAGGDDELIIALIRAKVTKPEHVDPAREARQAEVRQHVAHGAEFFRGGRYADAEAEFRAAVRLDPENADMHVDLGATLGDMGDWYGEIAEEREALRLDPNNEIAHADLGLALGARQDWDGAISEYREALRLNPGNGLAHANLGSALGVKGDWDDEIVEEREALRLDPNDDFAHVNLGFALGAKGDKDGAIAEEREALRLNPNNGLAHSNLGLVLISKGDRDGAISEYREALRLNPSNGFVHAALGDLLEKKGDKRGAFEEFRAAHVLDPNNSTYKQNYERLLQPSSDIGVATGTDISGEWTSLTSGTRRRVRVEEGHAYVQRLFTEEQSNAGLFQLCDLRYAEGKYVGTCKFQWATRWFDRWHNQWRTRMCQREGQMEFTKISASRIEGRGEEKGAGEKWSDKDNSNCGERFPVEWKDFVWIGPN